MNYDGDLILFEQPKDAKNDPLHDYTRTRIRPRHGQKRTDLGRLPPTHQRFHRCRVWMFCLRPASDQGGSAQWNPFAVSFIAIVQSIFGMLNARRFKRRMKAATVPCDVEISFNHEGFGAIDDFVSWKDVLEVNKTAKYWAIRCIRKNEENECLILADALDDELRQQIDFWVEQAR
jgi:hypothetical protein